MKYRLIAAAAVAALLVSSPAAAADKKKPTPKASDNPKASASRMLAESVPTPLQAYRDAMVTRAAAIEAINKAFSAAVKKAQRDFKAARAAAKTAEAKNQAEAVRKASIAFASTLRQQALNELGPAPTKPPRETPTPSASPTPST